MIAKIEKKLKTRPILRLTNKKLVSRHLHTAPSYLRPVKACPHCRRFRRQFVAENGDCRFLAVFCDSRRFRWQCGQGFSRLILNHSPGGAAYVEICSRPSQGLSLNLKDSSV